MTNDHDNEEGFSLIELLLVVVIIGIMSTVVVLSVDEIQTEADDSACLADRRLLETASEAYLADPNTDSIPDAGGPEGHEQTLVDAGFLRLTSEYYDLDAAGRLVPEVGSNCAV